MSLQDRIEHHNREAKRLFSIGQDVRAQAHLRLARKKAGERVNDVCGMDGLPVSSDRLPHPVLLNKWRRDGLVEFSDDSSHFRLTEKGRAYRIGAAG